MKHILLLSILVCAAFSAPAEEKQEPQETAVDVQTEELAPEPDLEARFNFCPDGWSTFGTRCYKFIHFYTSWMNAEEHCNSLGGHLASSTHQKEYNYLQQMARAAGQSSAWLGGFWLQHRWMWIDGEFFSNDNWYDRTPSNYPCIYLRSHDGRGNTHCDLGFQFICSMKQSHC